VRELRNVIRRAILVASDVIEREDLSFLPVAASSASAPREEAMAVGASLKQIGDAAAADAEQHAIRRVLQDTKGNKSEAARLLRTDYKTLHLKMKQYGIPAAQFRDAATRA
jgi:DNA-binding NtrC family response regulator